jgi:MFS family permease
MLDAGLDIFEVFVVNAAFTVGLVLFEIPTGVVADSTGRRRSFLLSVLKSAMPTEMRKVLQASIDFARNSRSAQLLMSVSLIQGTFSIWGFHAAQPYLLELLRRDAVWVAGIITALMALAINAGNLAGFSPDSVAAAQRC